LVLARALKFGLPVVQRNGKGGETLLPQLEAGWEAGPIQLGGEVWNKKGKPLAGAAVRLVGKQAGGQTVQVGATVLTNEAGRYQFASVPAGEYTLVVEVPGQAPVQRSLTIFVGERGQPMPELAFPVEVPM
jgi:protocatechuate 3,4-dioxygenase beta subunit